MKKIISVSGRIGAGKDTVADYLVANHNYVKMSFAASLKDVVASVFGWDRTLLDGSTLESRQWREQTDLWWSEKLNMPHLTPRWVLQYWGTDLCRVHFHDKIWVASLEKKLLSVSDKIVITDARFFNELDAIKNNMGYTVRVERGETPEWYEAAKQFNTLKIDKPEILSNVHPSEFSSIGYDYHKTILNNDTLENLYNQAEKLIK
jgi:hypothetical protein